jgi:hypothetical protein
MSDLVTILLMYESDTFSASGVELEVDEAEKMAQRLTGQFLGVVEEGGTFTCDGVRLSAILDEIRGQGEGRDDE